MENGPQVYQGFTGALAPLAQQAGRALGRTIFGGGAGGVAGTVGGAVTGFGIGQMMGAGDACGWVIVTGKLVVHFPFVRFPLFLLVILKLFLVALAVHNAELTQIRLATR